MPHSQSQTGDLEFMGQLGLACPGLRSLDLRVNAYSQNVLPYVAVYNRASFSSLVEAMSAFPDLETLHFPGNLFKPEEMDLFLLLGVDIDNHARPARRAALQDVVHREMDAMAAMTAVAPELRRVSWVRQEDADKPLEERCIQYDINPTGSPTTDRSVLQMDFITQITTFSSPRVYELPKTICSPVWGPSFLGYRRSYDGFREFTRDYPWATFTALIILAVIICILIYMNFPLFLHIMTLFGVFHMAQARTFSGPIIMLFIVDLISKKLTKKLVKEVGKRSQVVVF